MHTHLLGKWHVSEDLADHSMPIIDDHGVRNPEVAEHYRATNYLQRFGYEAPSGIGADPHGMGRGFWRFSISSIRMT